MQSTDQAVKRLKLVRVVLTDHVAHARLGPGPERGRDVFWRARHPIVAEKSWQVAEIAPAHFECDRRLDLAQSGFSSRRLELRQLRGELVWPRDIRGQVPYVGIFCREPKHPRSDAANEERWTILSRTARDDFAISHGKVPSAEG